jgi:hypothetical protein
MDTKELVTDAALVGIAGFGAAKVMGKATTAMYEQTSGEAKEQEKEASYFDLKKSRAVIEADGHRRAGSG